MATTFIVFYKGVHSQVFPWLLLCVANWLDNRACSGVADISPLYHPNQAFNKHTGWNVWWLSLLGEVGVLPLIPFAFFDFVSCIHMPFLNKLSILYIMS